MNGLKVPACLTEPAIEKTSSSAEELHEQTQDSWLLESANS